MNIPQHQIDDLVARPSEGLPVEIKTWLDPTSAEGISKIARACLALRNQNGGFLIVGLNDNTLEVDAAGKPTNVRDAFHVDKIQQLVSRFAYDAFEIEVGFSKRDGIEIPVIIVPGGVQYPVASKANHTGPGGKQLIRIGDVYCRTLNANGRASTALAQPKDWRNIFDRCFENREADIGRFLRRHLGPSAEALVASLVQPSQPSLKAQAIAFLDDGKNYLTRAAKARHLKGTELDLANAAKFEVSLVMSPLQTNALPSAIFRQTLASSNPRLTGWPIWGDSSGFVDQTARPFVADGAWQALMIDAGDWPHLDFEFFDPNGRFYLARALQDDIRETRVQPRTALDPILTLLRVAETIAVGLAFARALGWEPEKTALGFAFRWTKLKGRHLEAWANPGVYISMNGVSATDNLTSYVEVPLDTSTNGIAPAVEAVVSQLFVQFGGYQLPRQAIEEWTRKLIERRL